jgi:hypothetical protein
MHSVTAYHVILFHASQFVPLLRTCSICQLSCAPSNIGANAMQNVMLASTISQGPVSGSQTLDCCGYESANHSKSCYTNYFMTSGGEGDTYFRVIVFCIPVTICETRPTTTVGNHSTQDIATRLCLMLCRGAEAQMWIGPWITGKQPRSMCFSCTVLYGFIACTSASLE